MILIFLSSGVSAELRVSASDNHSVTVTYLPDYTEKIDSNSDIVSLFLRGGDNLHIPGNPVLPVYYAYIAVPPESQPVVRLVDRMPGKVIQGRLKIFEPDENEEAQQHQLLQAPRRNEVLGRTELMSMAGIKVICVPIYPTNIISNNEAIEIAERIEIRVDFNKNISSAEFKSVRTSNFQNKIIVNVEQAKGWGRHQTSDFDETSWPKGFLYRFKIDRENIYSLTFDELVESGVELPANGTASANIRLFGNGGIELPLDPGDPAPLGLIECAIYVDDGGDDVFQPGDRIIFYGSGAGGWVQDGERSWRYDINHYENYNYYWLNIDPSGGGSRMRSYKEETTFPDIISSTGIARHHIEPERFIYNTAGFVGSGRNWYGYTFDGISSSSYYIDLSDPDTSSEAKLRIRVAKSRGYLPEIEIAINGDSLTVISPVLSHSLANHEIPINISSMLLNGRNTIKLTQNRTGMQAIFDWLELDCQYSLNQSGIFEGINFTGYVEYHVSDVSNCWVFDITDHNNVGIELDSAIMVYQRLPYTHRYYIVDESNLAEVTSPFEE
ncbi:MAG: hypothetical protein HQ568_07240, partial [Calditrichaeota bacterium]|nr:hypothetical protein [Calditrichota bacterium]